MTAAVNYSAAATPAEHSGFFSGPDFGQKSNDLSRLCHILYFCEQGPINLAVIDPQNEKDHIPTCPKCTKENDAVTFAVNSSGAPTPPEHSAIFSGLDFGQKK